MKYRPEIDGLRALAVVPVVLFHAGFGLFKGGYVGVDVFFVISGFLITTIILEEIALGKFTLKNFYLRRIRRIIPVLYFVTLITAVASWFVLMPDDFDSFTKSVFGVTTFSSNIVFWLQSGYFDTETELKPLLHTWSLAVEEQFYIFFPLLLILLTKHRATIFWLVIGTIFVLSLVVSERMSFSSPEFAFYQLFTRSWELMLGVIVAVITIQRRWIKSKLINEILGVIGISMILYAVFFYNNHTPFPGFFALVPTLGTALVILSTTEKILISKLFSLRIMTAIGLLSYSIYLWHQPILALARYRSIGDLSPFAIWFIVFAVIPVSYLSWRYLEVPCRKNLGFKSGVSIVVIALVCSSILVISSYKTKGFNYRVTEQVYKSDQILKLDLEVSGRQEAFRRHRIPVQHKLAGATAIKPESRPITGRVLILGDSHSMHLETGFSQYLVDKYDLEIVVNYFQGCVPTIGYSKIYDIQQKRERSRQNLCREQVIEWESYLEKNKNNFDVVILAGRWNWLINASEYGPRQVREDAVWPVGEEIASLEKIRDARVVNFRNAVRNTLSYINNLGLKIIFISQVPLLNKHVKACDVVNDNGCAAPEYEAAAHRQSTVDEVLESIKEFDSESIIHFRPFEIFCKERERKCIVGKNKYVYYKDRNHLSELGSLMLSQEFVKRNPDFLNLKLGKKE